MSDRIGNLTVKSRAQLAIATVGLLILAMAPDSARPQAAPQPAPSVQAEPSPTPQPGEPAPSPEPVPLKENPGLLNEIGKLLDKPSSMLPTLKSPKETIDDLNARAKDATRDAGESLSRLAKPSSMVSGRMACPASSNGAPDCKLGADKLCQSKGFKEGYSLNADSAETCSARVLIPGRVRKPDDCRTDTYVTRALCQ